MDLKLKGKTALITGTSHGLGRAFVESFACEGANVIAHARKETLEFTAWCSDVSSKYGVSITPIFFDVTDDIAVKNAIRDIAIVKKMQIDVLLNNAGIMHESLLHMTTMSDARKQFDVNFFAPLLLVQIVSKFMMRQPSGGAIINMSSRSAFDGIVGGSVYGATKAALASLSKTLAKELGHYKIRVNCIAPGVIETPMTASLSDQVRDAQSQAAYVGRLGQPDDVAGVAVFLASDAARYITGQVVRVDGGLN